MTACLKCSSEVGYNSEYDYGPSYTSDEGASSCGLCIKDYYMHEGDCVRWVHL